MRVSRKGALHQPGACLLRLCVACEAAFSDELTPHRPDALTLVTFDMECTGCCTPPTRSNLNALHAHSTTFCAFFMFSQTRACSTPLWIAPCDTGNNLSIRGPCFSGAYCCRVSSEHINAVLCRSSQARSCPLQCTQRAPPHTTP